MRKHILKSPRNTQQHPNVSLKVPCALYMFCFTEFRSPNLNERIIHSNYGHFFRYPIMRSFSGAFPASIGYIRFGENIFSCWVDEFHDALLLKHRNGTL